MRPIYFISDAHLGSRAIAHGRTQERRLVRFLDDIKDKAGAVYILGDLFDFWYEYKLVVPKGYTRLLGKLSELTDLGVEVHFFTGNHDIWCYDYFERECGMVIHREPLTIELGDQTFFLAHGDGLGDPDPKFRFIRTIFRNRLCQHYVNTGEMPKSYGDFYRKMEILRERGEYDCFYEANEEDVQKGFPQAKEIVDTIAERVKDK